MPRIVHTTVYNYEELNDAAQAKARDWYREKVLPYDDTWQEYVYEDFETICGILGITLRKRSEKHGIQNHQGRDRCIWYSGFCRQGDGACFEGQWVHAPNSTRLIRDQAPRDETLHKIADTLAAIQKRNFYQLRAVMTHRGMYYHEYTMNVEVERDSEQEQEPTKDAPETTTNAMRDLARWLYRRLEDVWNSETCDESVQEAITANVWAFKESGNHFIP